MQLISFCVKSIMNMSSAMVVVPYNATNKKKSKMNEMRFCEDWILYLNLNDSF